MCQSSSILYVGRSPSLATDKWYTFASWTRTQAALGEHAELTHWELGHRAGTPAKKILHICSLLVSWLFLRIRFIYSL